MSFNYYPEPYLNTSVNTVNNNYLQSNNYKTEYLSDQQSLSKNNNNTIQNNNIVAPHFEYVSYDKVQDLYEQRKGHFYFIPEGFEPVLVPKAQTITRLLKTSKPIDTDVHLPSFALPYSVDKAPSNALVFSKQPPRLPNILYQRAKHDHLSL